MEQRELEELKQRSPIVDVARDLGCEVTRNRMRCLRPESHAHGDRTPSLSLDPVRGSFRCWVCPDVRGDVIDLVRARLGCGFSEALAYLQNRAGLPAPLPSASSRTRRTPEAPVRPNSGPRHPSSSPGAQTDSDQPMLDFSSSPKAADPPDSPRPGRRGSSVPPLPAPLDPGRKSEILAALFQTAAPVAGAAARYLKQRRIFQPVWEAQGLRVVDDYRRVSAALEAAFPAEELKASGICNDNGHLRFYRHTLLLPYRDAQGRPQSLQARALDPEIRPKELTLPGGVPAPYNAGILDGLPGIVYLCEGAIDTLTLLGAGFPAVGVPGAGNFKPAWASLFRGKRVFVAFDGDAAGEAGAVRVLAELGGAGIDAHRQPIPPGLDVNAWLAGGRGPRTPPGLE